jgi:alkanesulfonate monooxygenase SsuD/methylene tetrahydromethanopterin reductase-like flavin-dependent oxidoreductase (luciferase family)
VRPEGACGAAVHVIGGAIDREWTRAFAEAHERAGFDRVPVGYTSTSAYGFVVIAYCTSVTERLGFVAPTVAARKAATLDHVTGGRRLIDFAAHAEVHEKRLWMPIAAATGGAGNTTALVGMPEQVAESLIDYHNAGATTLPIRGFDLAERRRGVRP